jgi:NDP-sugar pyrophosphorylase family protein
MKTYISIFVLILFASCNNKYDETKAKIIERKVIDENNILIKYAFIAGNKTIVDSVRTKNKVIPHDSLTVTYSASDPTKNTLKFH